jgi:hypothetical protein
MDLPVQAWLLAPQAGNEAWHQALLARRLTLQQML